MRNLLLSFAVSFLAFNSFAQTATYDQVINKKVIGKIQQYTAKSGQIFQVGDTLTLGVPSRNDQFNYIHEIRASGHHPLPNTASDSIVAIKKINIHSITTMVIVYTTKPQVFVNELIISNLEGAITDGEIKSKIMSSDQALSELNKWKDKLELKLISQEEYDAKKAELIKYIQ